MELEDIQIINLTPHPVRIFISDRESYIFPISDKVARLVSHTKVEEGLPLWKFPRKLIKDRGRGLILTGLPAPTDGVYYIVSYTTAREAKRMGRPTYDLLIPGGDNIKIEGEDKILGCTHFQQFDIRKEAEQ